MLILLHFNDYFRVSYIESAPFKPAKREAIMRTYKIKLTQTELYQIYTLKKVNKNLWKSIGSWEVIKVPSIVK